MRQEIPKLQIFLTHVMFEPDENDIYYSTPRYESGITYPVTLAENEVFVLCDYREGAKDSRYFGPVSKSEIKGKVITIVRRSNL